MPNYPPEVFSDSDSDSLYYYGFDKIEKPPAYVHPVNKDNDLVDAIKTGNLEEMKKLIAELKIQVDDIISGDYTMLMNACLYGEVAAVEYLLKELKADPNKQVDSDTALLTVCKIEHSDKKSVETIVKLLIEHGAGINTLDKYGVTPFLYACQNGYVEAVRLMIGKVYMEAADHNKQTAVFYAIKNNQAEVLKILIEAGFSLTVCCSKGYTPRQVAEYYGFYDLLEILPQVEQKYVVPAKFLMYDSIYERIPRLFLKTECPEYFPDLYTIITSMGAQHCLEHFALNQVSLGEFLSLSDDDLKRIGIILSVDRQRILKGLLHFHSKDIVNLPIETVGRHTNENFYDLLLMTANHLKNLVILNSSVRYVKGNIENDLCGPISKEDIQGLRKAVQDYRRSILNIKGTAKYLASFSPPQNPVYIDYKEIVKERKRRKLKKLFGFTTAILGISLLVCLKFKGRL